MIRQAKHLTEQIRILLYEVAMATGTSLDLRLMLRESLSTLLRKLNCSAGGVFLCREGGAPGPYCDLIYTIPKNVERNALFQKAHKTVNALCADNDPSKIRERLPHAGETDGRNFFYVLELPGFGLILLLKQGEPLMPVILTAIRPLMVKLAQACRACLQGETLAEEKERLAVTLRSIGDGVITTDVNGRVAMVNKAAEILTGWAQSEAAGRPLQEVFRIINEKTRAVCVNPVETVLRTGLVVGLANDTVLVAKDGSERIIADSGAAIRDREGRIIGVVLVFNDITERKKSENALRKTEDRNRALLDAIPDLMFQISKDGVFLNYKAVKEEMLFRPSAEFIGKKVGEILPPEVARETMKKIEAALSTREVQTMEYRLPISGGPEDFEARIVASGDEDAIVIVRDITKKKEAEEALRKSEERFREIAEMLPNIICETDAEGRVTYVNEAAYSLLGYSKEEVDAGLKLSGIVVPAERERLAARFPRILKGESVKNVEWRLLKKDGGEMIGLINTHPIYRDKDVVGIRSCITDITERKRSEVELKQSFEKFKRSLEGAINAMALTIEMRDPYTAGHQRRVTDLACAIYQELGFSGDELDVIRMSGPIHDIGKIYIPAEILSKPTLLNEYELGIIKNHPQIGYDILKNVEFPWPIARIVLQHHERLNGMGYPAGLKGDEILLEARVMGVADVVETMASHRPYRPALGLPAALEEIRKNRGKLYDPAVVDACLLIFERKSFSFIEEDKAMVT